MSISATSSILSMSMASMASTTMSSVSSSATVMSGMGEMEGGMSMDGEDTCKISMLWNWYTIDACFLSRGWQVKSSGMFAGSCIGVILLVMSLEFLRRLAKEYDRCLIQQHNDRLASSNADSESSSPEPGANKNGALAMSNRLLGGGPKNASLFRPTVFQQMTRAFLHMMQFAVAYFVMLLAMYYNGYIIISIFIGAYLGFFVFCWESINTSGPKEEATLCCG